ncbi:hypothetical protein [Viscerimonas tarda]
MRTRRFCPHCGKELLKSRIKGYTYQCLYCSEDFYRIEVLHKKDMKRVKSLRRYYVAPLYDRWWYCAEFKIMGTITGYRQFDFPSDEGYQAFVDACDAWWEALPKEDKIAIFKEYK